MVATAGVVQIESCKFLRYNCDHPVFQKEYTRSNRKAGTKCKIADLVRCVLISRWQILRCFPHCCPEHAPRCYCGCSIHILVTFKDASIVNDSEIVVCARFEASSSENHDGDDGDGAVPTRKLTHGELVVLPPEVLQPMPQDSLECLWIRSYREGEGKQQSVPKNSILYVLNNYRFPKWFYGYESGATKNQREMKHYLRVYVMRLERPKDVPVNWSGSWFASVVARHTSPGFTLISYRRASDPKRVVKTVKTEYVNQEDDAESDSSTESEYDERDAALRRMRLQTQISRYRQILKPDLQDRQDHDNAEGILFGLRYGDQHHHQYHRHHTTDRDSLSDEGQADIFHDEARLSRDMDDKLFWRQPKYLEVLECARQLSVLQYFIVHAPMDELWNPVVGLEDRLRRSWIEPIFRGTRDLRSRKLLARFSLPPLFRHQQYRRDQESLFGHHPVLVLCAELAVECVTSQTLRDLVESTLSVEFEPAHQRKGKARQQFAALVDGVYSHLSAFLAERKVTRTIADLVDEIVTLVHQNQRFRWMLIPIREILAMGTPDKFAFEALSAQSREFVMKRHHQARPRAGVGTGALPHGAPAEQWNRRWLLDSRSLRFHDANESTREISHYSPRSAVDEFRFTAWELLAMFQQVGTIDLELDGSRVLRIHSAMGSRPVVHHRSSQQMELILDSKYRIFRSFPDGMSTMAVAKDGWMYGDYFGHFESPSSIKIQFFAYKHNSRSGVINGDGSSPARCISVHLTLNDSPGSHFDGREYGHDNSQLLHVSVKIDDAMCPSIGDEGERDGDLAYLPSGIRHSVWKSLDWKSSTEFQVRFQQIEVS